MKKLFKYQGYHLLAYIILGLFLLFICSETEESKKTIWRMTANQWVLFSWIFAGIFQAWIFIFWRLELYYGKIKKWFGNSGFPVFRAGFVLLGSLRLLPIIPISVLTGNTIEINNWISYALILITTPLILWCMYSVTFYFGINRLFGADHFYSKYREGTLEKRGIFKYLPNSIYTVMLLIFYHPGLFFHSSLGLLTALIHHIFVWVHFFCAEKPDMKEIYGKIDK